MQTPVDQTDSKAPTLPPISNCSGFRDPEKAGLQNSTAGKMGSILVNEDIHNENPEENESVGVYTLPTAQIDDNGFQSFKIDSLASNQPTSPTGVREEILLLSWLIVLLRTREGSQISYEWAYKSQGDGFEFEKEIRRLAMVEIVSGIQSTIGDTATAISHHIATVSPSKPAAVSSPVSLLLSTSSLSQTSEEAKDEVSK